MAWETRLVVCHGGVIVNLMGAWFPAENRGFYEWQPAACGGWRVEFDGRTPIRFEPIYKMPRRRAQSYYIKEVSTMRYKAILADLARKRYPLSIMLIVIGVLVIPFPYLFIHFGLEFTNFWWSLFGISSGIVTGSVIVGFGSLVEDIHDISMHTVGYDLEDRRNPEDKVIDHRRVGRRLKLMR